MKYIIGVVALLVWSHICVKAGYELARTDMQEGRVPR